LYSEAITAWEETMPQATADSYRKIGTARLAPSFLRLGAIHSREGNLGPAEENLKKAIDYGEKAVALDPSRPLCQHNLLVARRELEDLRDLVFQGEVERLSRGGHFLDVVNMYARDIEDKDQRLRAGKDVELVVPILADRLDRLAWLLAHCPNAHVRDTKVAVEHARRASELCPKEREYLCTLAAVQ
jgi:hypothetical protein